MKNKQIIISLGILAVILIAGVFGNNKPPLAHAGASQNVSGWAWSNMDDPTTSADESTIGWVSFNSKDCDANNDGKSDGAPAGCPSAGTAIADYGVNIDPTTGAFSGYGWSENIGWIYFGQNNALAKLAPEEPKQFAKLDLTTNQVTGWAYAVAGGGNSGGWDGWIKMSGNATDVNKSPYGVSRNNCKLQGYAWGSDVVGWLQFDPINVDCQNLPPEPPVITTLPGEKTLLVDLKAAVDALNWQDSLSGTAPLNEVDLQATVSGTAQGSINYKFDCNNDGSYEKTFDNISDNPKQVDNLCDYQAAGTYTAKVLAERDGLSASDTVSITVSATPTYTLNISVSGSGSVTSVPVGISCGTDCAENYDSGKSVTLTASAVSGSTFTDWSGACSGAGSCVVTMNAAKSVIATFSIITPPPTFSFSPSPVSVNGQLLCDNTTHTFYSLPIITVSSINGFNSNISLSFKSIPFLPTGVTYGLYEGEGNPSDYVITPSEYGSGFQLGITVPATVCQEIRGVSFEILGNGGEASASVNVNIGSISPTFRER